MALYVLRNLTANKLFVPPPVNTTIPAHGSAQVELSSGVLRDLRASPLAVKRQLSIEAVDAPTPAAVVTGDTVGTLTTDMVAEGSRLYHTPERVAAEPHVASAFEHSQRQGNPHSATTDDVTEGGGNLYYTPERVAAHPSVKGLEAKAHGHVNAPVLAALTDAGSGRVITDDERARIPARLEREGLAAANNPSRLNPFVTSQDPRLSDTRAPHGEAGGDLAGEYPNPRVRGITLGDNDAVGDVYFRGSGGLARLPAGEDGQRLTTHGPGRAPSWSAATATHVEVIVSQPSHGLHVLDPVTLVGSKWVAAKADRVETMADGVVSRVISDDSFALVQAGVLTGIVHGRRRGSCLYLSPDTAGGLVEKPPLTGYMQMMLKVVDELTLLVLPSASSFDGLAAARNFELPVEPNQVLFSDARRSTTGSPDLTWVGGRLGVGVPQPGAALHVKGDGILIEGSNASLTLVGDNGARADVGLDGTRLKVAAAGLSINAGRDFRFHAGASGTRLQTRGLVLSSLGGMFIDDGHDPDGVNTALTIKGQGSGHLLSLVGVGKTKVGDGNVYPLTVTSDGRLGINNPYPSATETIDVVGSLALSGPQAALTVKKSAKEGGGLLTLGDYTLTAYEQGGPLVISGGRGSLVVDRGSALGLNVAPLPHNRATIKLDHDERVSFLTHDAAVGAYLHATPTGVGLHLLSAGIETVRLSPDGPVVFALPGQQSGAAFGGSAVAEAARVHIRDTDWRGEALLRLSSSSSLPRHALLIEQEAAKKTWAWGIDLDVKGVLRFVDASVGYAPLSLHAGRVGVNSEPTLGTTFLIQSDPEIRDGWVLAANNTSPVGNGLKINLRSSSPAQAGLLVTTGAKLAQGEALRVQADGAVRVPLIGHAGGTPVVIDAGGYLRAETSSVRYKTDVLDLGDTLSRLLALRPVDYVRKNAGDDRRREVGLLAEEVAEVFPELVNLNAQGEPESVAYGRLSVVLLRAFQDLVKKLGM